MITIFISRTLETDSIFNNTLSTSNVRIIGQSLVQFRPIYFEALPKVDWIFFYSKTAIRFFFQNIKTKNINLPPVRFGTIGKASAEYLKEFVSTVDFVGNGKPQETAAAFEQIATHQSILFPRANNSRQSVQAAIAANVTIIDLVIYDNQIKNDFHLPPCHFLVFTSPLNAIAYFKKYSITTQQTVIAIGNTTASCLYNLGIKNVQIASVPSEKGLTLTVRSCLENY